VLAAQTLPDYKCILRPDGDNKPEPGEKAD
jgi:hypothetical protein